MREDPLIVFGVETNPYSGSPTATIEHGSGHAVHVPFRPHRGAARREGIPSLRAVPAYVARQEQNGGENRDEPRCSALSENLRQQIEALEGNRAKE